MRVERQAITGVTKVNYLAKSRRTGDLPGGRCTTGIFSCHVPCPAIVLNSDTPLYCCDRLWCVVLLWKIVM